MGAESWRWFVIPRAATAHAMRVALKASIFVGETLCGEPVRSPFLDDDPHADRCAKCSDLAREPFADA